MDLVRGAACGVGAKPAPTGDAASGYAAVDALVALMIISMTLIMSFKAMAQAGQTTAAATEVRRAEALLSYLLESTPRGYEVAAGRTDGFAWRVELDATGAERPVEVCRRAASLTSVDSGRTYKAATLETCPVGAVS
ncbi:hypothetical protein [Phenylobacterium sp.]|uniref:hypothetical protein n=1 Tax=Phenylobacterium sp. TaxID=1871053 RepID=UPI0030F499AF